MNFLASDGKLLKLIIIQAYNGTVELSLSFDSVQPPTSATIQGCLVKIKYTLYS